MTPNQFDWRETLSKAPLYSSPPLEKGGFSQRRTTKSRSIPICQRGKLWFRSLAQQRTELVAITVALLFFLIAPSFTHAQPLPAAEKQKIETLIKHVGDLKDAKFVRNGSTYEPATAVRFLRGKWDANKAEVKTVRDFIDKVATKSGTSGKPYVMRFADGKEIPSRDYLLSELKKLES